jgi:hypothetical protein
MGQNLVSLQLYRISIRSQMSTDDPSSLRMSNDCHGHHYRQEMTGHSHITFYTLFYIAGKNKPVILRLFHTM